MITFRTIAEIREDRRVVLTVPPGTPTGKAEFMVTVAPEQAEVEAKGVLRRQFGMVRSSNPRSADNDAIDADLAKAYETSHE